MFMNTKVPQINAFIPQCVFSHLRLIINCIKYLVNSTSSVTPKSRFLLQCSGPDRPEEWFGATPGSFCRNTFQGCHEVSPEVPASTHAGILQ